MKTSHLTKLMLSVAVTTLVMQAPTLLATTFAVFITVDTAAPSFSPAQITIAPGDTVVWHWPEVACNHSVTSGTGCHPDGLFDSGNHRVANYTFSYTFQVSGTFPYYSDPECDKGTVGSVTVAEAGPAGPQILNISTRLRVGTDDNALIGGFIVTGDAPKKILLRAIGPSLGDLGLIGVLADPILELHAKDGSLIMTNDDWKETQQTEIEATNAAPTNDLESALIATLAPDSYTAIVRGKNQSSGVGLVEGYDLDEAANSQLANISTRGFVEAGNDVMIGGFILGNGTGSANILIRALGPSLTSVGVAGAMADPTLELHDENGALVMSNDNWKESQQTEIEATGIPPQNDLEAAILASVPATAHTAIVAGKDGATGVALVEVYHLP